MGIRNNNTVKLTHKTNKSGANIVSKVLTLSDKAEQLSQFIRFSNVAELMGIGREIAESKQKQAELIKSATPAQIQRLFNILDEMFNGEEFSNSSKTNQLYLEIPALEDLQSLDMSISRTINYHIGKGNSFHLGVTYKHYDRSREPFTGNIEVYPNNVYFHTEKNNAPQYYMFGLCKKLFETDFLS